MAEGRGPRRSGYTVGYGRPPKAAQFKPGKSGNPKGRPKGTRSIGAMLNEIVHQKVPVTDNGKTKKLSALEVMLRRLANDAMRADHGAIKLLLSLIDRYSESPETAMQLREMLAEDEAILAQYLRKPAHSAAVSNKRRTGNASQEPSP